MLKEQQAVPPTLEQCTIRDQTENTRGVSIIFYPTLKIILPYLAKPRVVVNY